MRMERRFPIAELRTLVARVLNEGDYLAPASGRVRAVPDTRTIRYYTTLGLIDRPAQMVGRTAFYGERHVLQLVAIKRLQAANKTLSDIQQCLVGITNTRLRQIAQLPNQFWETADDYLKRQSREESAIQESSGAATDAFGAEETDEAFWAIKPSHTAIEDEELGTTAVEPTPQPVSSSLNMRSCLKLSLSTGVELSIDTDAGSKPPSGHIDLQRLAEAAEPLLKELTRQGLLAMDRPTADTDTASADHENESSQS